MTTPITEFWLQIHFQVGKKNHKYNLPIPSGQKVLDGVTIEFARRKVTGGYRLLINLTPSEDIRITSFILTGFLDNKGIQGVFVNGYQSWTESYEHIPEERHHGLKWPGKLLGFHRFGDSDIHSDSERRGRFHGYGYAYLRYADRMFLISSLNEYAGYTIIGTDIRQELFTLTKDLSGLKISATTQVLDVALLEGSESEVFDSYRHMRGISVTPEKQRFAWISIPPWGRRPDELNIRRNLATLREKNIPLDYFIIGEGWQSAIGVWGMTSPHFPSGMSSLSAEIRGSGYSPGIWYAPFVVGVDSAIFRTRRDWLVPTGRSIKPAGNRDRLNGDYFALDITRSDVKAYIEESYKRLTQQWRYEIIILDLLFAVGRNPINGLSRGATMQKAMEFLYSLKGGEKWLVNGTPLDACYGKADYLGVCTENGMCWERNVQWNLHFRERRSVRNAVRTLVGRRQLNGRFGQTAPASICLNTQKMDDRQRYTQLLLSLIFGNFITFSHYQTESDPELPRMLSPFYSHEKPEIFFVEDKKRIVTVGYRYANREYLSFSNLAWRARHSVLPDGLWYCTNYSDKKVDRWNGGTDFNLEIGESRNYLRLKDEDEDISDLGDIFPGL